MRINMLYNKESQEFKNDGVLLSLKRIRNAFLLVLVLALLTTIVYTVEETEQVIITTLGKVTKIQGAGLNFKLPYPIQSKTRVEVNKTQKIQMGYKSNEEISKNIAFNPQEAKMITGDFNIVNIDFFIEWKISDPVKYVFNSDNPIEILKLVTQSSARSIIGSKNVDGVLTTEKPIIQAEIKEKMVEKLSKYDIGIQVIDVKIQDSEPPTTEVSNAFKAVETAKQEKETYINEALAYKNSKIPEANSLADKIIRDAESYKESRINAAKGEVARFNEMYLEYAKNKGVTKSRMYLETIEKVLPGIEVYIDSSSNGVQKLLPLREFSIGGGTNE